MVKNLPVNAQDVKDTGSIPGSGRSPEGGHGNPPQYSSLENPHGQRMLAGYSPWGCKELDTIKQLSTAQHMDSVLLIMTAGIYQMPRTILSCIFYAS